MAGRSPLVSLGWSARDYLKRVWDNSAEDNVLFLAGGIAFNILLAAVPFFLLLVAGVTYLLPAVYQSGDVDSARAVTSFIERLLPTFDAGVGSPMHTFVNDVLKTRGSVTFYSAILFVWFSTRLFGSLRTVLATLFDIDSERGIIAGKIFDIQITVVATMLFVASTAVTAYVALGTTRGVRLLVAAGLRDDVMSGVESFIGRALAFVLMALMFFALYKYLPIRRVRARTAWVAALFTTFAFEGARVVFGYYVRAATPATIYTGTITALVVLVIWVYYAALIFILGGEVAQVYELRRVRRLQREVFGLDEPAPAPVVARRPTP